MSNAAQHHSLLRRIPVKLVLLGGLGMVGLASPALAGTRAGVDVSLAGKVATNPFNASDPGPAVVALSPSVAPWLTYEDPNTTVELRGSVLVDQYTKIYGRNTNGSAHLGLDQLLSSTVTLHAAGDYFYSDSGVHDLLLARATAADAVAPPTTPLPDISTAGLRTRTWGYSGRVGFDAKLSGRDSMSLTVSAAMTNSDASSTSDYANETAYLSFNRQFSERTAAFLSFQASNVDYLRTTNGDGTILSPLVGIRQQFSSRLHADVSLGATFASFTGIGGIKNNFTVLAGNLQLCDTINHGTICLDAARTAQPTALGGISASSDISLQVDQSIGKSNSISVTGHYSRVSQTNQLSKFQQDFAGLMVTYTRKFNDRFSVFVTPSFSKTFDNVATRDPDYEVRAGVRLRFGAIR